MWLSGMFKMMQATVQGSMLETEGRAKQAQWQARAKAEQYNAAVLRQRSETTKSLYGLAEDQQRRQGRMEAGERHAATAQSGTGAGGSNADVERQSQVNAELDALNIRYQGLLQANAMDNEANLKDWNAKNYNNFGEYERDIGEMGMAAAMLGGAASATSMMGIGGG